MREREGRFWSSWPPRASSRPNPPAKGLPLEFDSVSFLLHQQHNHHHHHGQQQQQERRDPPCVHMYCSSLVGHIAFHYTAFHYNTTLVTPITIMRMRNGPNWLRIAPYDKNLARKNTRKHNLTMSHLLIPKALMGIRFKALATCEWQLSQHRLCIRPRYTWLASWTASSQRTLPPF